MLLKPLFPSPLHASILHLIPIPLHCSSTWVPMRTYHLICSPYPKITHILQYPSFMFLYTHIFKPPHAHQTCYSLPMHMTASISFLINLHTHFCAHTPITISYLPFITKTSPHLTYRPARHPTSHLYLPFRHQTHFFHHPVNPFPSSITRTLIHQALISQSSIPASQSLDAFFQAHAQSQQLQSW